MGLLKFNCPHCSQALEAAEETGGSKFGCPKCGQEAEVPITATAAVAAPAATASEPVCSICLSPIAQSDSKTACPSCDAAYHAECWTENAGCAVYGCSQAPAVESRRAIEIPVSYWGQEHKNCPQCG